MSTIADAIVLALEGDLCIAELPEVRDRIDVLVNGGARRIVLDLTEVTLVTAAALRVFETTQHRLVGQGGSLQLRNPTALAVRVLEIGGLSHLLEAPGTGSAGVAP